VAVLRLDKLQAQGEEHGGLEDPLLKVLPGHGLVQELPPLLVWEVGLYKVLRVGQEVEVVEPSKRKTKTPERV